MDLRFKRGNMVVDSLFFVVIMFVFVLIIFFGKIVSTDINTEIQADSDVSVQGKAISNTIDTKYSVLFDNIIILAFILFWVLTIAFSFLIDTNPIFFVVSLVLLVGVLVSAAYFGNAYEELISDDTLGSVANGFPKANFVFTHLLGFVVAISLTLGVSLYAKTRI